MSGPRQVPVTARAATVLLEALRLDIEAMRADADAARRDAESARGTSDVKRDYAERAARMTAEFNGANRLYERVKALARG